ncbi:DUF1153 domain-containing protein [Rubellimicrobium sp. CFH 75288]|uniref:CtrA inhibitor SciP n=1 Tax=Rubellimicrobium sp. CFH 75288 TaxID=2697034 RepID=UPI001412ABC0|nr:DUF1153 domain-containing protein [Rubellimicrobium sp. CFH 75288]NAZ36961.1 DUF1153 domain-containing protein [Rubellimicrobium sp. CFH 75288]
MYLRRVEGPRAVTLPDGSVMTRADLPPRDTRRWVASRKAAVLRAVAAGLISRATALEMYGLSEEEFSEWEQAVARHGTGGLRTTWLQRYRQPERETTRSSTTVTGR